MQKQAHMLAAVAVSAATLSALADTAAAHQTIAARKAVALARTVIKATDDAPVTETHDGEVIHGHTLYTSYSDRTTRRAATYLAGELVQGSAGHTLYAASGKCFTHQNLRQFVGLSQLAAGLLPLPSSSRPITYALAGRTLYWREPATRRHGVEHGTVAFDRHHRITSSRTAAYMYKKHRVKAQALRVSYPAHVPSSVPAAPPMPACHAG